MNLSTYLKNALAAAVLGGVPYTPPTSLYLHLYISDPTVDDTGTEVTSYTPLQVTFDPPVNGQCINSGIIIFTGLSSARISHGGLKDEAGNLLFFGAINPVILLNGGDTLEFDVGDIIAGLS